MNQNNVDVDEWIKEKFGATQLPIGGVVPAYATSLAFKTGDWKVYKPVLHDNKCTGCVKCYFVCPDDAIRMDEQDHPIFAMDYCKGCTLCADICPAEAIEMELETK